MFAKVSLGPWSIIENTDSPPYCLLKNKNVSQWDTETFKYILKLQNINKSTDHHSPRGLMDKALAS